MSTYLNVGQVAANMNVLGYGCRAGVWVQGCGIGCPGCSSLHTHDPAVGRQVEVGAIIQWLRAQTRPVVGLTLSGGEPSSQSPGVVKLIEAFRDTFPLADVLLFSGLTWSRLVRGHHNLVAACDVVIAGPYVHHLPPQPLRGSSNQTVHLLTDLANERYRDLDSWPVHATQAVFVKDHIVTVGIPSTEDLTRRFLDTGNFDPSTASWVQHTTGVGQ